MLWASHLAGTDREDRKILRQSRNASMVAGVHRVCKHAPHMGRVRTALTGSGIDGYESNLRCPG